jgi:hypothetical protein
MNALPAAVEMIDTSIVRVHQHAAYSWENVAKGVIAAAQGKLGELPFPAVTAQNQRSKDIT